MTRSIQFALFVFIPLFIYSCNNDNDNFELQTLKLSTVAPNYMEGGVFPFIGDIVPEEIKDFNQLIHLGRVLFYDKSLSAGNTVACGSCHHQQFAFADPFEHSIGIGSQLSSRNTPTIINTSFGSGLFWDQSALDLSDLVLRPIGNHQEMGFSNIDELVKKLESVEHYDDLFDKAYTEPTITKDRISQALTMFCSSLNSFDSDLDLFGTNAVALSPIQQVGMQLFEQKQCNSCHGVLSNGTIAANSFRAFDGNSSSSGYLGAGQTGDIANIGLDNVYADNGVGALNGKQRDNGKFKIPTLRNITLTPPYMHDGRFATLNEVLDFYSEGIQPHENLDTKLREADGSPMKIELAETEKSAIIAFLHTLTSKEILNNPHLSDPFE